MYVGGGLERERGSVRNLKEAATVITGIDLHLINPVLDLVLSCCASSYGS